MRNPEFKCHYTHHYSTTTIMMLQEFWVWNVSAAKKSQQRFVLLYTVIIIIKALSHLSIVPTLHYKMRKLLLSFKCKHWVLSICRRQFIMCKMLLQECWNLNVNGPWFTKLRDLINNSLVWEKIHNSHLRIMVNQHYEAYIGTIFNSIY